MTMNFREAARVLREEFTSLGYEVWLDAEHNHPRLYFKVGDQSRFAILSSTENYDSGNILNVKRQDIRRDVLPHLPAPEVNNGTKPKPAAVEQTMADLDKVRTYPVKVFINQGKLIVSVPKSAIPNGARATASMTVEQHRLMLIFSPDAEVAPNKGRTADQWWYRFKRDQVPFKYASKSPGPNGPQLFARKIGETLTLTTPLPTNLLVDPPKVATEALEDASIDYGKRLLGRFNAWLAAAANRDLDPKVTLDGLVISVEVAEVRRTKL